MEADLLKQIVKNTAHKTSFQIIVILDLIQRFSWIGRKNMKKHWLTSKLITRFLTSMRLTMCSFTLQIMVIRG